MVRVLESNNETGKCKRKIVPFLEPKFGKKCKHCCCLHGFELKSFSFPLITWEDGDSMSSNDSETFPERHKNDSVWRQRAHPHPHTHSPVNGGWHKHLALL
jgi:hypothetical protein